ncbi:ABC transporter ATP-binding protein [Sabulicella glaciei]|uniref:ATP-binding cassette domain-containing protein n=1 Tax=Sabulicella glaciei TaxID=2984948 RepID=A0ABT3P1B0_9PROT|nr:oligopeptide/dipeptide ABC transporter ATP-binding protein [Roseococcus sp. MDT2-1-1]MCW8088199.1 ATP-binding cassette domain-containing protein [Roseococcus sp. MDT2-1-1]
MSAEDRPILELRDVVKRYSVSRGLFASKRTLMAVGGVSLSVRRRQVLGLVGESGCGKSTLAKMVLGLETPSEGEVLIDGRPIASLGRLERARLVQPVFQDPYSSLNPRKTVASIIGLPLSVHGEGSSAERRGRVEEMLRLVGLAPRHAAAYPSQLSGGQRQRVAIARALILRPQLLICDEPTSALDVSVQAQILNLLMDLQSRLGLTCLFISHNLAVVQMLATRVAVMYLGRVVEEGPTAEVMLHAQHPYSLGLLASVLTPDPRLGLPETGLGSVFPDPLSPPPGCAFHPRCPLAFDRCRVESPLLLAHRDGARAACHAAERHAMVAA